MFAQDRRQLGGKLPDQALGSFGSRNAKSYPFHVFRIRFRSGFAPSVRVERFSARKSLFWVDSVQDGEQRTYGSWLYARKRPCEGAGCALEPRGLAVRHASRICGPSSTTSIYTHVAVHDDGEPGDLFDF